MRLALLAAAVLCLSTSVALADTVTQSFSTSFGSSSQPSLAKDFTIQQFDPSLGTLNAITGSFSGTATEDPVYFDTLELGSNAGVLAVSSGIGNTQAGSRTSVDPFALAYATGTGSADLTLNLTEMGGFVDAFSVDLTYSYTPAPLASAVSPEPASIALLGSGMLGLAGLVLKRRSA